MNQDTNRCNSNNNRTNQNFRLQNMDSPVRFESTKVGGVFNAGESELGEIKIIVPTSSKDILMTSSNINETSTSENLPCGNGGCKATSKIRRIPETRTESPWHRLKTIFLVSVVIAFVVWVIVYTILAQYQIL